MRTLFIQICLPADFCGIAFNRNIVNDEAIFIQFGQDLLVYEGGVIIQRGDGVHLGNIKVAWPKETRPEKITLIAGLYSLEGKPKYNERITHPIRWLEMKNVTAEKPLGQNSNQQKTKPMYFALFISIVVLFVVLLKRITSVYLDREDRG